MRKTKEENRIERELKRIETEKNQKHVKELTISIEWKKSRTWGSNPHASVQVEYYPTPERGNENGSFERRDGYKCSGCGYDKTSTVVAEIFNNFLMYKLYEPKRPWSEHLNGKVVDFPYGVYMPGYLREGSRPMYNGGIGMSCFPDIAQFIGGRFETVASGKMFDVFKYVDG